MKIACFYNDLIEKDYLEKKLSGHEVEFLPEPMNDHSGWKSDAELLSVFVKSNVGAKEMDSMPNLKFIATRSTGFDHIDLEEANKRGVVVSNIPTYGENTVAELAFALILDLSRKMYASYDRVRSEGSFSQSGLRGFDLMGKTIGIVGTGHIGRYAIKMAHGFGMNILAFDINKDEEFRAEYGFKYVELDELFASSDIITLHVPYNPHTHHLINRDNIKNFKKGSYIINTSRGAVIETDALIIGLKEGIIAGAGLDVLEEEGPMFDHMLAFGESHPNEGVLKTLLENHYLIDHPNVIITPHNAFNTNEAIERILETTVENIGAFSSGTPQNIVEKK